MPFSIRSEAARGSPLAAIIEGILAGTWVGTPEPSATRPLGVFPKLGSPSTYARLGDDAFEHVEGAGERLGGVDHRLRVVSGDRLPGAIDHTARLLHRVLPEIAAGDRL